MTALCHDSLGSTTSGDVSPVSLATPNNNRQGNAFVDQDFEPVQHHLVRWQHQGLPPDSCCCIGSTYALQATAAWWGAYRLALLAARAMRYQQQWQSYLCLDQNLSEVAGRATTCACPVYRCFLQYAFNLFSHNSSMDPELGYNEEEMKMVKETKKIWGTNDVAITATCVRVPVMRAHAESINLEFDRDISEADALDVLGKFPGVSIVDDRWG
eukprot:GHUV01046738.1.p1 GENE.GHUV01046738.1~~GHUV01046738.1.p1  ORF type:complete len:213 (-),score=60.20 GHUV01046738.1:10-648(-)